MSFLTAGVKACSTGSLGVQCEAPAQIVRCRLCKVVQQGWVFG